MKYIDAEKLKYEIERRKLSNYYIDTDDYEAKLFEIIDSLQQEQQEEPDKSLEEAAWDCVLDSVDVNNPVLLPKYKELLTYLFIAGAEWQKEQDQPITGNSLEKEWLRYVDKKKKECGGELPALGEYGWLQIARHFAEWQKSQMLKDAVEGEVIKTDKHTSVRYKSFYGTDRYFYGIADKQFKPGDKVRIIVVKAEEE